VKVLIVEDHPTDLKLARAVIDTGGHESIERCTAEGALAVMRSYQPDVILLDLKLPGLDGIGFAREAQRHSDTRAIPIVAVTAYWTEYRAVDVLTSGCVMCLTKPINTRELLGRLRAVVARENGSGAP
jgi:DNA-binding response OmpR family regulator